MSMAVVTGASSGIGRAMARVAASEGHGVVLVARRADRLIELADEIRASGRSAEVLIADLATASGVAAVTARLSDADALVDLLVNCAGITTYGSFAETALPAMLAQSRLHLDVAMTLMHAVLPQLIRRGSGGIVNIASTAGLQATPGLAAYSASKAGLIALSESVHQEVRSAGVTVTCVCPGYTRTELQQVAGVDASGLPSASWMTAEDVAHQAWRAYRRRRAVFVPGALNRLSNAGLAFTPRPLRRRATARVVALVRHEEERTPTTA